MTFQESAKDAIRASGGRITSQREILLDLLAGLDGDIDAEQLHQQAVQHDPNISVPTVYRTLHTLEEAELLQSRYISNDHDRKAYFIEDSVDVFHFTCRNCGKRITFASKLLDQLKQDIRGQLAVDLQTLCMCASGLCADCRQKEEIV